MGRQHIADWFEDQARAPNGGQYAIAYALLQNARATERAAKALEALGNGDAATHMGAIEGLAMKVEEAARIIAGREE